MAIYLGSSRAKAIRSSVVDVESPYTGQIIEGAISEYSNNRIDTVGIHAFAYCSNLISISFLNCSKIGSYAFRHCYNLTSVSFPNCEIIENYAFENCSNITSVDFPNCSYIGNSVFLSCNKLTTVSFPNCSYIGNHAFNKCYSLASVSFPNCSYIGIYAFAFCFNLLSLYLLGSSIPTLSSTTAFSSTPISNYTTSTGGVYGSIYVPASLYNNYITATNWSVYSARIVSV